MVNIPYRSKSQGVILEQNVGSMTPLQIKSGPGIRGSKPLKNVCQTTVCQKTNNRLPKNR